MSVNVDNVLINCKYRGGGETVPNDSSVNSLQTVFRLFTDADRQVFSRPTYKALIDLFDNYEGDTAVRETITQAELAENDAFLDAVMATQVMRDAHQFLVQKGLFDLIWQSLIQNLVDFKPCVKWGSRVSIEWKQLWASDR